ncbi:hypothetical protein TSOC_010101 [Tetrabaena socialis]|uniref:Uncharacterized protein n=1 Tax=Tetrabaena socialis TaxID=47790 RepID=A0A2J7ZU83_9CHLO|nr:hypothetical protein TSOC_010101 [Tetrabaena socialis]|eukprot:PNH03808.1 hypothetical protein TSOC_010101 [Tetrabaena socialis]
MDPAPALRRDHNLAAQRLRRARLSFKRARLVCIKGPHHNHSVDFAIAHPHLLRRLLFQEGEGGGALALLEHLGHGDAAVQVLQAVAEQYSSGWLAAASAAPKLVNGAAAPAAPSPNGLAAGAGAPSNPPCPPEAPNALVGMLPEDGQAAVAAGATMPR